MSKTEEAREALEALLRSLVGTQAEVMEAANAYALAAHVAACRDFIYKNAITQYASSQAFSEKRHCGDGWLCPQAKEIEELR